MTLLDFQLIIITTATIQVAVLNRFSWNSHGRCESTHRWTLYFFGNNRSNKTTTGFLAFIQPVWRFLRKKFQSRIWYPISCRKDSIHFCRPIPHSLKNGHALQKLFFTVILENIVFFICYMKNIQNHISYKKVYIDFCCQTPPSPQNGVVLPQMFFCHFFSINWKTFARFSCSKV